MPSLDHALTFETIKRHYRRAERAIKRCDSLADAVPTPALNQLRYAGYHIIVAILADKAGDAAKTARELLEAEEHCRRAWLDAFDSVTRYHLKVIRAFEERQYPLRIVEKHIPDFAVSMAHARDVYRVYRMPAMVQEMSVVQRVKRIGDQKKIAVLFMQLTKLDRAFNDALADEDAAERKWNSVFAFISSTTSVLTSVFGLLLSAAGLVTINAKEHPYIVWLGKIGVGMFAVLLLANLVPVAKRIMKKCKCGKHPDWDA